MGSGFLDEGFALLPLVVVVPLVAWHARRGGHGWRTVALRIAFCGWLAALVAVVLFPLPLPPYDVVDASTQDYRGWPYPWISPVPFETIRSSLEQGWNFPAGKFLVGNIAAFIPLGILAPLLSLRWRTWRRAFALGLAASLVVEMTQLVLSLAMGFPWRVADVDDLILNTLGTLIGFGAWWVGRRIVRVKTAPAS